MTHQEGLDTAPRGDIRPGTLARTDVVFTFSFESFEDAVRRGMGRPPDRLLSTLLQHDRVGKLIVADPFRSAPVRFVRRLLGRGAELPDREDTYWVRPLRLRRQDPTALDDLIRTYRAYDGRLRTAVRTKGLSEPALITFNPLVAAFCDLDWAGTVTYYARDDWSAYPVQRRLGDALELATTRIRDRRHRVCAVSHVLLNRIDPKAPSAVVPNGIDPAEWYGEPSVPDWYRQLPRPVAVYAGSIDRRLDVEAVRQAAGALEPGCVILMGPILEEPLGRELSAMPNVHLPGRQTRPHVAGMVRTSDLCLIPHVRSELTEAMSPLKLYEYLAGGRPVVATDTPPIRRTGGRTVLVSDPVGWSVAVEEGLSLGPADESERVAFIESHSWRARHRDVLRLALGSSRSV